MDFETNQRAVRRFLNLRLIDVERATGIAASRISESERGVRPLRPSEQRVVTTFLREKLVAVLDEERARVSLVAGRDV
jgi:transcriptional regulator with XRE-family HTH domain